MPELLAAQRDARVRALSWREIELRAGATDKVCDLELGADLNGYTRAGR